MSKDQNIEKVLKVLTLEREKGFSNQAVIGGLEDFISNNVENEEALTKIEGYSDKSGWERKQAVEEIENLLQSSPSENGSGSQLSMDDPIDKAKGVGEKRGQLFRKLGVQTIEDLLFYFPREVEDRREEVPIGKVKEGEKVSVSGRIGTVNTIQPRSDLKLVKAAVHDDTGKLYAVWFNQPWIQNQLNTGEEVAAYGEIEKKFGETQMENPVWEPKDHRKETRSLVPIYEATEGLNQSTIRWIINNNLELLSGNIADYVPSEVLTDHGYLGRERALRAIHQPRRPGDFERGRESLSFSELYLFHYGLIHKKEETKGECKVATEGESVQQFLEVLPFQLTGDQEAAVKEISEDLQNTKPMSRLLQGDVGTGKTVVAAAAIYLTARAEGQTAMMAPTTVLARQHYRRLSQYYRDLDLDLALLTGDTPMEDRKKVIDRAKSGELDLLIGTHALLEDPIKFDDLRLAVIDEEQRFGVAQRSSLLGKKGIQNKLVMSATPIPRSITATLYGQFEITRLEEFPYGEKHVETYWYSEGKREGVYAYLKDKLEEGFQAFVVVPLVEDSEELDARSARTLQSELREDRLSEFEVGLLHGQMDHSQKQETIKKLSEGELDLLVATTVIEVGIDVPEVGILVIEHADLFGLTQLHQLRGRIGRGGEEAYCFAIATPTTDTGRRRLETFRDTLDGFQIVEEDLKIRGPGNLLGPEQHGFESSFRACDFIEDLGIMKSARQEAQRHFERNPQEQGLIEEVKRVFGSSFKWLKA